ncbi:MAG: hypothetical protein JGK17_02930 [Microcoleus sp. PH2017_10_PVI_O_A]|uniref:hypothetical protein n=1 Tax=unclassified Microcoleus TaxID=2642155 RepID=UPI001E0E8991|nr:MULTISPECIES: hypothetical protein [unclassified Microcoleus]TAE83435.1 MAG: hypothetical protein EAZ83_09040 [Oscillatoriales cyanobacterium]MCC3404540.1 hypothetical protein [Microcoleus sp. PH2017_10_PVI_O_A]MCC3458608.1 hypothetical protein [Microcoleus sp. PH2017_11_PCY_U_A]MCC3476858.1 hypothetical protein [Microcoleus sp. PH2017_12_PCY_D_A]MCC3559186.1 hypothetical protein [Microcoleus sp. PH2017_27_LUM_O_A]
MKRISDINPLGSERPNPSDAEREKLRQERLQREKSLGFQQLTELCTLGEYDMAKQLAAKHSSWGYEIVDGVVMEQID